jgi:transcriptional regulator with XRE-family HTH domain
MVLDCFTHGICAAEVSESQARSKESAELQRTWITVRDPKSMDHLVDELDNAISSFSQPVRLVIQGWTEMAGLWNGEEGVLDFFNRYCRRIREVGGVAYWIVEKVERVTNIQNQLNQIAQIAIELFPKQGKAFLAPIKAENRPPQVLRQRQSFLIKDDFVTFPYDQRSPGQIHLGRRLREVRVKRGLSQAEIADGIGVSASTISQIENNLIFPSLSNFLEIADMLRVDPSFLLKGDSYYDEKEVVFPRSKAIDVTPGSLPKGSVTVRSYTREYSDSRAELFFIEIPRNMALNSHFFKHKGEEIGCLLSGTLLFRLGGRDFQLRPGDVVRFVSEIPDQWENAGPSRATLFWVKIR